MIYNHRLSDKSIVLAVLLLGVLFPVKTYASTFSAVPKGSESAELKNAIEVWRQEADSYQNQQQSRQEIETRLTIAESLLRLGKFDEANSELGRIRKLLRPSDTAYLARAYRQLGDVHAGQGNYQRAVSFYLESLEKEKTLTTLNNTVKVLLDRRASSLLQASRVQRQQDADTFQSQASIATAQAEKYAIEALAMAESKRSISAVQALINWHTLPKQTLNKEQLARGRNLIDRLPPSPQMLMTVIDWAKVDRDNPERWLQQAMNQAQNLQNPLLTSYVSLELGQLYFAWDRDELAQKYATQSVKAAGGALNYNSLFRAQELLARINLRRNQPTDALNAYREAIISIEQLNKDGSFITPLQVVTFNQQIEPIYRNTLNLILDENAQQEELTEAKEVSDKLRLVQLRRYFGDNCLEVTTAASDASLATPDNAKNHPTVNSIVLEDRLVTLLELPDGSIKQHTTEITQEALQELVSELSRELISGVAFLFRQPSRQLYQMLLAPFEDELEAIEPETVVFINDGMLRNIPMAVLIDKQDRYVAEKWATINSLGLNYRPPVRLQKKDELESALALGLPYTPYDRDVAPLPYVPEEVNAVEEIFGGKKMLGKNFTTDTLSQQLEKESYPLVHLATHGYFGGTAETSYIYAYDRRIPLLQLDQMLRDSQQSAPELLVLSACETALGNDLSLLGLGGLATRRGIDTTLGSLWFVQDEEQAAVIQEFYRRIEEDNQPLAIALQQIQQQLIEQFAHPSIWASLILIGET